jgi:hypothetical protein
MVNNSINNKTNLPLSHLTQRDHYICYCTVHGYILCDSMWSFKLEANFCRFVIVCLYMYCRCRWRSSYQDGRVGIPLTGLTLPHFSTCHKPLNKNSWNTKTNIMDELLVWSLTENKRIIKYFRNMWEYFRLYHNLNIKAISRLFVSINSNNKFGKYIIFKKPMVFSWKKICVIPTIDLLTLLSIVGTKSFRNRYVTCKKSLRISKGSCDYPFGVSKLLKYQVEQYTISIVLS